jgi:hypothetical protein
MLFDLAEGPHEQVNLAARRPEIAARGLALLSAWHQEMMKDAARGRDPLESVVAEGGPYHVRGALPKYLERLRATGRAESAERLSRKYPAAL